MAPFTGVEIQFTLHFLFLDLRLFAKIYAGKVNGTVTLPGGDEMSEMRG